MSDTTPVNEILTDLNNEHPLYVFYEENLYIKKLIEEFETCDFNKDKEEYINVFNQLARAEIRYTRKENQLFPYLEKYGWYGPSQGMWSFHDHIRDIYRDIRKKIANNDDKDMNTQKAFLCSEMKRMTAIEEGHLFPYAKTLLTEEDWNNIKAGDSEIGWAHKEIDQVNNETHFQSHPLKNISDLNSLIDLDVGRLSSEQINLIFKFMPFDITLVDENDRVVFYNRGDERVFPRSPGVIGREVRFCHPPKSLDKVLRILKEFRQGTRDVADFWIDYRGKKIHIRYFAVRDQSKNYKGVIEVSQDITEIQTLTGEQRLLNWD